MEFDSNLNTYCLKFNNSQLYKNQFLAENVGGVNGNTVTFFLCCNTYSVRAQSNFNFTRETSPGVYDTSWRLNAALPFSNGSIYIAHANATGGKIVKSFSGRYGDIVNKPVLWTYVRNGSTAKAYLDGTLDH